MREILFEASVVNQDGVDGVAFVDRPDGLRVVTSNPVSERPGTNPEELLGLAFATCMNATIKAVLKREQLQRDSKVTVDVQLKLDESDNSYYFDVVLRAMIEGLTLEEAERIVAVAEKRCPVSKLLKGADTLTIETVPYK
ncbi:OsmC family protein [Aerococcaceae bacterium DSM 111176]|nr:OsmC family protein [Aerococcaceae bacterium DSM 111176]